MTSPLYPSPSQLRSLCLWMTGGTDALDVNSTPEVRKQDTRVHHLRELNRLSYRLGLPDAYLDMISLPFARYAKEGRPLGATLDPALGSELYRTCRRWGYVLKDGAGIPPLSANRMQMLTRISWGSTYQSTSDAMGLAGANTVSAAMSTAREQTGTATLANLISCAFRNGWLPTNAELLEMSPSNSHGEVLAMLAVWPEDDA